MYDPLAHHRIAELEARLDKLKHLENIECVLPLEKEELGGYGLVLSLNEALLPDPSATGVGTINADTTPDQLITSSGGTVAITQPTAGTTNLEVTNLGIDTINGDGTAAQLITSTPISITQPLPGETNLAVNTDVFKVAGGASYATHAWSAGQNYGVGDIANSGGSSYRCILAHINHVPPNATYWALLSGGSASISTTTYVQHKAAGETFFAETTAGFNFELTTLDVETTRSFGVFMVPAKHTFGYAAWGEDTAMKASRFVIHAESSLGVLDTAICYSIYVGGSTLDGLWATDPIGNIFSGGILTTLGTATAITSISGGATGLTATGTSAITLGGTLNPVSGGLGVDAGAYDGLPIFTAGVASDLTDTRASGTALELKAATGKWIKIDAPAAY